LRHVAVHALRAGGSGGMEEMLFPLEFLRLVALQAKPVPLGAQAPGMWFVAIAAGHVVLVHPALQEGARLEHLIEDLPVRMVQALGQRAEQEAGIKIRRWIGVREFGAARVAGAAGLQLRAEGARNRAWLGACSPCGL